MKICRVCNLPKTNYLVVKNYEMKMCHDCYKAQRRASHAKVKDARNAVALQRYHANHNGTKDKHHARMAKRYQEQGAQVRVWFESLPIEEKRRIAREKQARYRANLTDSYVRLHVTTKVQVPQSLIEAKRLQIQIQRYCHEKL